jgi:hypothetical protein
MKEKIMSTTEPKEGKIYVMDGGDYNMLLGKCGGSFGASFWQIEVIGSSEYLQRNGLFRHVGYKEENLIDASDLPELAFEMSQEVEIAVGVLKGDVVIIRTVHARKVDGKWQIGYVVDGTDGTQDLMYREEELKLITEVIDG